MIFGPDCAYWPFAEHALKACSFGPAPNASWAPKITTPVKTSIPFPHGIDWPIDDY